VQSDSERRPKALVLFDIDGTLIRRAGPHHREALVEAVRRVAGVETTTDNIPVQGMLDRDILTWMLNAAGVSPSAIRRLMPELVRKAQWIYARRCPADLRDKVCPGVPPLLAALRRERLPAGLVTGNLTRIAWKKMERAGLKSYFRFGAFAELGATRSHLVNLALRHARAEGWLSHRTTVSLIGDHPNDIRAAKDNRVRAIAVATGLSPIEELAAHQPDLLLRDLTTLDVSMLQQ
jgi:phosphoglycolate phosphatase-like HAD superfamily hydrolase